MKYHDSGSWNLHPALAQSCNTYFAQTYMRIINKYSTPSQGVDAWYNHLASFGLDNYMGYDLPVGQKGFIPNSKYYQKVYPNGRRSEEHTSELQSRPHLVCRLLLEKKKNE